MIEVRGEVYFPVKAFEQLNVTADRGGGPAVREPAQRRGRLAPTEGREGHGVPAAPDVGALVRGGGGHLVRTRTRSSSPGPRRSGCPVPPTTEHRRGSEGGHRVPPAMGEEAALRRLGDRRRRDQGRRREAPAPARRDEPRSAVGDRLQVPARGTDRAAEVDRGAHRPHREGHAVRRPRARVRGGRHDHERDAAQRGRGPPEGRPQGRHGDRPPRGRRDPGDRRAGPGEAAEERAAVEDAEGLHLVRDRARAARRGGGLALPEQGRLSRSVRGVAVPLRGTGSDGHRGPRLQDGHRPAGARLHRGPRRHLRGSPRSSSRELAGFKDKSIAERSSARSRDPRTGPSGGCSPALNIRHVGSHVAEVLASGVPDRSTRSRRHRPRRSTTSPRSGPRSRRRSQRGSPTRRTSPWSRSSATAGVRLEDQPPRTGPKPLEGKTIVLTGGLDTLSRDEATRLAQRAGARGLLQCLQEDRLRGRGREPGLETR